MFYMFFRADVFNQDISEWDVSKVTDMFWMFNGATSFNQDLCPWGNKIQSSARVIEMFEDSGCPQKGDPNLSSSPISPFCHVCD